MKQETVNSFDGGLNLDLNPITTPNNVLTDCLNGTFLTFNGDEMVLQNDAGNTTIDYNGTPVQLSERFYPLGIREYGGVLYIISAKKPIDNSVLYDTNTYYFIGNIVHSLITGKKIYFESRSNYNLGKPLPIETDAFWKVIGDIDDFNNYYGEVEFGSYPSPEFGGSTSNYGECLINDSTVTNFLYKPTPINSYDFKSGRYIKFSSTLSNTSNISQYDLSNKTYIKNFYKFKLWHQLNNGFYDLTEDIWTRYLETTNVGSPNFWLNNTDFKYYCPNLYKGKLAISLEIELPNIFQLVSPPTINYNIIDQIYTFTIQVNGQSGSSIWDIRGINLNYKILDKGGEVKFESIISSNSSNNISTVIFTVPFEYTDYILDYTITPIIYCNNIDATPELPLILEYWKNVTLHGTRIISAVINNVIFVPDRYICSSSEPPISSATCVVLTNTNGLYINDNLEIWPTPYEFLETNSVPSHQSTTIAYYTIVNGYPIIDTNKPVSSIIEQDVIDSFLKLYLSKEDSTCAPVVEQGYVRIVTSLPIARKYVTLTFGEAIYYSGGVDADQEEVTNNHTFDQYFAIDDWVTCSITSPLYVYENNDFYGLDCIEPVTYKFQITNTDINSRSIGLISKIYIGDVSNDNNIHAFTPYVLYWDDIINLSVNTESALINLKIDGTQIDGVNNKDCLLGVWDRNIIWSLDVLYITNQIILQVEASFINTSHTGYYDNLGVTGHPVLTCGNSDYNFVFYPDPIIISSSDFI